MKTTNKLPRSQRYRKRLPVAFGTAAKPVHSGFSTNLSASGLGLTTQNAHPAGTRLFLRFTLPDSTTLEAQGLVAWSRPAEQAIGLGGSMGVRLLSADEAYFRLLLVAAAPQQG